jgi:hypothetical protein
MDETPTPAATKEPVDTNLRLDEHGRIIPLTEEQRRARTEKILKMLEKIAAIPDDPESPDEAFWRAMDESRPDRPLFRELYTP